ncbi:MAG: hypothetical protein JWQ74_1782 [Marmoricola sp.]|nr:hypothetical protein [Marmoricola sp.]
MAGGTSCEIDLQVADSTPTDTSATVFDFPNGGPQTAVSGGNYYRYTVAETGKHYDASTPNGLVRTAFTAPVHGNMNGQPATCFEDLGGKTWHLRVDEYANGTGIDSACYALKFGPSGGLPNSANTGAPSACGSVTDPCKGKSLIQSWSKKASTGAPKVGKTAKVSKTIASACGRAAKVTFKYAWKVGSKVVSTSTAYKAVSKYKGKALNFKVTAYKGKTAVSSKAIAFGKIKS